MRFSFFNLKAHLIIYGLLLTAGTILFRLTDLDLWVSDLWYFGSGDWTEIEHPFWGPVYKLCTGPNIFALFISLVVFVYAALISKNDKIKWSALCVAIAITLGPGLAINGTLKPLMGRPRPYVIERYNGSEKFVPVLKPSNIGKSFPSGHAGSGFVLTILFYVLYRNRKKLAWTCWFGGFGLGVLLSIGRIAQGGHFASDTFWAFGVTQLVNAVVYFSLQPRIIRGEGTQSRKFSQASFKEKSIVLSSSTLISTVFIVGYLINFPFTFYNTSFTRVPKEVREITIDADLERERIKLFGRDTRRIGIDHLAFANGFPWSNVFPVTSSTVEGQKMTYSIVIKQSGAFRDYRGRIKIFLPKGVRVDFSQMKGTVVEDNRE